MYRKVDSVPTEPENFQLPFEEKLSQDNRWVIMSKLIPWEEFEEEYAKNFAVDIGAPALPFRMALGALIIKEKLGRKKREEKSDKKTTAIYKKKLIKYRAANPVRGDA